MFTMFKKYETSLATAHFLSGSTTCFPRPGLSRKQKYSMEAQHGVAKALSQIDLLSLL